MTHRHVFVAGLHRSGTSPLFRCLRDHPDISGFRNTGAPEDEGQHLQSVYPTARQHGGPGRFGFDPAAHLTESSPLATRAAAARLFREWRPHSSASSEHGLKRPDFRFDHFFVLPDNHLRRNDRAEKSVPARHV